MVRGKSNQNISFNEFYIFGYFQLFTTMFNIPVILFIKRRVVLLKVMNDLLGISSYETMLILSL